MPFCHKCGHPLIDGAGFCGTCGTQVVLPPGPLAPYLNAPQYPAPQFPPPAKDNQALIIILVCLAGGAFVVLPILAAILVPNFIRARAQGQVTACKSNLKNIGTALEMYSTDNAGNFPERLERLTGNYLKAIPTCPSIGRDTYSDGYGVYNAPPNAADYRDANSHVYTVTCAGTNHSGVRLRANFPQYLSSQGLVEH